MFRFSIRDVLWLTVVVALGVGWFLHWTKSATREREMQSEIKLHKDVKFASDFWAGVLARQLDEARAKAEQLAKANDNLRPPVFTPVGTTEPVAPGSDPFAR